MTIPTPQPIPYQGSKRKLAPMVLKHFPATIETLYEPFAGSAAISVASARDNLASRYVLGDSFAPLMGLWDRILDNPTALADAYETMWNAQLGDERQYYDRTRDVFNQDQAPVKLLYLLARCVKNAVRFNAAGHFNQSPDNRRKGMRPATFRKRALQVHGLLGGKTTTHVGDYTHALKTATPADLVYMDPPYMGVSGSRDGRYHQGLDRGRFVKAMAAANKRGCRYLLSFDGRKGNVTYGDPLPAVLRLHQLELHAGRSTQATLNGRDEDTYESLYISPALVPELRASGVITVPKSALPIEGKPLPLSI